MNKKITLFLSLFFSTALLASDGGTGESPEDAFPPQINGSCQDTNEAWAELLASVAATPTAEKLYSTGCRARSAADYVALMQAAGKHLPRLTTICLGWTEPPLAGPDGDIIATAIKDHLSGLPISEVSFVFAMTEAGSASLASAVTAWKNTLESFYMESASAAALPLLEALAGAPNLHFVTLSGAAVEGADEMVRTFNARREAAGVRAPLALRIGTAVCSLPLAPAAEASSEGGGGASGGATAAAASSEAPEEE